jgi:two-component system chemotaxis sensor kinase CheA
LLQACDLVREQVQAIAQGLPAGRFRIVSYERHEAHQNPAELGTPLTPTNPLPAAQAAGEVEKAEKADSDSHSQHNHANDASIRISVEKMDILLEAVGELAICQSQVSGGIEATGATGHLASEASRLGKISRQLQEIVISLRMVPVHPLFLRMTRLARDLSRKTGKALQLDLEGGETEIDRRMVESLTEPLVHLIRNAVDHGLEEAGERLQAGKPTEARLKLSARHQGGDFVLELSDDGRGLNFGRLAHQARVLGFLAEGETPDREKLVALIFEPGFSTAEKITEVSGRGVGLDAVKRKIQSLKGSIVVESEAGKGTLFRLRIPLTLALMDGILVRVGNTRYVLPAFQVQGFLAQEATEEHALGTGGKWLATRQGHLPLIDLEENFGNRRDGKLRPVVVQVEAGGRGACLMVDEVLGKQQVVIKELGEGLHDLKGVSGGAILGDGRVGLIVDMEALIGRLAAGPARN